MRPKELSSSRGRGTRERGNEKKCGAPEVCGAREHQPSGPPTRSAETNGGGVKLRCKRVRLHCEVKLPTLSRAARLEAGVDLTVAAFRREDQTAH